MIEQLKRYWIGLLVVVLVALHGAIVAMIRIEAASAKQIASCEVDLGTYIVAGNETSGPMQMRIHSLSPVSHRIQSRRLIQLNEFQIKEAIETFLRQSPTALMQDPVLADLKQQLLDIMIQTVGKSAIEDVLVTDLHPVDPRSQWAFGTASVKAAPKMVITRREEYDELEAAAKQQIEAAAHAAEHDSHGGHGDSHGDAHGEDSHGGGHGENSHEAPAHGDSHSSSEGEPAHGHASNEDSHGHH
jgi:hypothetical protein